MTLTNEDIARLTGLGKKNFYDYNRGYHRLRNVNGHCIFLDRGLCSIHEHKPAGCRLYPLILDMDTGEAILHDYCPFNHEFEFTDDDRKALKELVSLEEKERDERVLDRLHSLSGHRRGKEH